jgi:cytochrome c2
MDRKPAQTAVLLAVWAFAVLWVFPATARLSLSAPSADLLSGSAFEGRKVFVQKSCVRCHSVWGSGGKVGPDLSRVGERTSPFEFAGILWNHSPRMLAAMQREGMELPSMEPEDFQNLLAYMYFSPHLDDQGDFERGHRLFREKQCIVCHSVGGAGGAVEPHLDKYAGTMSAVAFAQTLWNHGGKMSETMRQRGITRPAFQKGDLADLLAYLRGASLEVAPNSRFQEPGDAALGKRLFTQKGCIKCHSVHGTGGKVGPDLGQRRLTGTVSEIAAHLWNHGPNMWAKMKELGIPKPQFSDNDLSHLLAYLYREGLSEPPGKPESGKRLFNEKGCIRCHSVGAIGGTSGPDLAKSGAADSFARFSAGLWNHAAKMQETLRTMGIPWPHFEGSEVRHLFGYLAASARSASTRRTTPPARGDGPNPGIPPAKNGQR